MAKRVERVLIYRLGSLGDTIVALPALRVVERAFPSAERRMLTNIPVNVKAPSPVMMLVNTGLIHSYLRYEVGTRSAWALLALWWRVIRFRPQALVYLTASRGIKVAQRDKVFFRLCGISVFYGVPETEELQRNRWQPEHNALEPEAEYLCRRVAELGDGGLDDPANWDLCLTLAEYDRGRAVLGDLAGRPLIAASVGTKMQSKDWGRENWRALLATIALQYPGYGLMLSGAPEESAASEYAAEGWRAQAGSGPAVNVCGQLTPRETAAAFSLARIFVGHDSGPMHLAAAVAVPCVAIFAALNLPRIWYPHGPGHEVIYHAVDCAGCGLEVCVAQKKKCITSITADEVMSRVRIVMERPR